MEPPVLADKDIFPTEEIIYSHLGKTKELWNSLFGFINTQLPDVHEEWNYYNDGKSWLLKVKRKSKTICWVSVIEGAFRMTFYFGGKAEADVMNSDLPESIKESFAEGRSFGKIKGLTIIFSSKKDVENAKKLILLKLKLK